MAHSKLFWRDKRLVLVCAIIISAVMGVVFFLLKDDKDAVMVQAIVDAVALERLLPGNYQGTRSRAVVQSGIDPKSVSIVIQTNGTVFLLWKSEQGWHGNYHGYVCSTAPIRSSLIIKDHYGRQSLGLDDLDSQYPVIEQFIGAKCCRVFFDLN